ncbi:MAG: hypothetical protein IMW89_13175 [Ktedonobacteraceae bacterium]|nr:hypothetical protein [Ktedonobacteraceae bacterium]
MGKSCSTPPILILVYSDALEEITDRAFSTLPEDAPLQDALVHIFSSFIRFYERHPENARHFLKELLFDTGERRYQQQFGSLSKGFLERLAQLVRRAQQRGEIRQDVDPQQAASSFFALYFAAVTAWLGSFLILDSTSFDQLRAMFDLQIKGMLP